MKMISYLLVILCLLQLTPLQAVQVTNSAPQAAVTNRLPPRLLQQLKYRHREPFVAGLLSTFFWGMGHFYTKEYTRGSLLMFGDLIYKGMLVGLLLKLKNRYTDSAGDDTVNWKELSGSDKGLVIGYLVSWVGISLWAAYDAAESANRFNRKFDLRNKLDLQLKPDSGGAGIQLGWKRRF